MEYRISRVSHLKRYLIVLLFLTPMIAFGQSDKMSKDSTDSAILDWLIDLYDAGVSMDEDSVYVSEEAQRLLDDEQYRQLIYPKTYTWEVALEFINKQHLKKAFWYLINLYLINDQNKNLVVKSVQAYDQVFNMDKILVGTYYTYCYMDPEIGEIVDGSPEIKAPHIMEEKLRAVKEILFYVEKLKEENKK